MKVDLSLFRNAKILVVGDLMLDKYWHGKTSRISPEAPVPVVAVQKEEARPGGSANAALNIASLGAQATLSGIVGNDGAATDLEKMLSATDINCQFVCRDNFSTITKLRIISQHQQLIRADFEEDFHDHTDSDVLDKVSSELGNVNALLLSDYGKGALRDCPEIIQKAREKNIPILVDPKGSDFTKYKGATLLTPNLHEFETIVGVCRGEEELVAKGQKLIEDLDLEALLITRSEHGMTLVKRNGDAHHFPARAKEVFDVTGAGDTVIATLTTAISAGYDFETAAALSNVAAGIVVGKLGTAAITAPELKQAIDSESELEQGVLTRDQLAAAVANARAHGRKVVFTNGCFDILHAGHVGYLQDAKKLGDRLIVAVNDDASVSRLKGPGRPVNGVDRRMAVLAGLKAVDWVVSFSEDTPIPLLELIRPDILVKGGDYKIDEIVGGELVLEYGGEINVLSVEENCSTTATIEKIKETS